MRLSEGELPLINSVGDPKFPAFLYDEDAINESFAWGLFRGPFLLVVSLGCFYVRDSVDKVFRYINTSLCHLLQLPAQRC